MTWPEYERACRGYEIRQWRAWDHTRHLMAQQYNMLPAAKNKRKQVLSPQKYMPLPIDGPVKEVQNAEALRSFRDRMKAELQAPLSTTNQPPA